MRKGERNPKARRCGVCGLPGHNRRAHDRPRRNVDFFTADQVVHPVRGSAGYREWLTRSEKGGAQRAELRKRLAEQRKRRGGRFVR